MTHWGPCTITWSGIAKTSLAFLRTSIWPQPSYVGSETLHQIWHSYYNFFFPVVLRIIDINHCVSLRCTASRFGLHIMRNDYYNKSIWHVFSHINKRKRKQETILLVTRILGIYSLNHFPIYLTAVSAVVLTLHATYLVLIYLITSDNWKFVLMTTFFQFLLPTTSASGNHKFDLFFRVWLFLFLFYSICLLFFNTEKYTIDKCFSCSLQNIQLEVT